MEGQEKAVQERHDYRGSGEFDFIAERLTSSFVDKFRKDSKVFRLGKEESEEAYHLLLSRLISDGKNYVGIPREQLEFENTVCFVIDKDEDNKKFVVLIPNKEGNAHLQVWLDKQGVICYGDSHIEEHGIRKTFRVFPERRRDKSKNESKDVYANSVLLDFLSPTLAYSEPPSFIMVTPDQLYNPDVEPEITPAPVFYLKLGFVPKSGTQIDSEFPIIKDKLRRGEKLEDRELIRLASHDLFYDLAGEIRTYLSGKMTAGRESSELLKELKGVFSGIGKSDIGVPVNKSEVKRLIERIKQI